MVKALPDCLIRLVAEQRPARHDGLAPPAVERAGDDELVGGEGKLLEALRQESEEQLAGKDQEIADIRGKLAGLDQDDFLKANYDELKRIVEKHKRALR